MNSITKEFLKRMVEVGYTRVAIRVAHPKIEHSTTHVFGSQRSVFGYPAVKDDGWPAIWEICSDMNIGAGCGNGQQYQIRSNVPLENGYYEFDDNSWSKIK